MRWSFLNRFRGSISTFRLPLGSAEIVRLKNQLDKNPTLQQQHLESFLQQKAPAYARARKEVLLPNASWENLKLYSTFCRHDSTQADYETILYRFDPDLKLPPAQSPEFIGDGFGEDSLNSYRRLGIRDQTLFEKIFLKDSPDQTKAIWFSNSIQPQLEANGVKTPRLVQCIEGSRLSVHYYEFLPEFKPIDRFAIIQLYKKWLSSFQKLQPIPCSMPTQSFIGHALYVDGFKKATLLLEKDFPKAAIRLRQMENQISNCPSLFSHGDFYPKNISFDEVFFDWDRCGFYPEGFDLGYCLSKTTTFETVTDFCDYYHKKLPEAIFRNWLPNVLFFSLIFYSRRVGSNASDHFLLDLFEKAEVQLGL